MASVEEHVCHIVDGAGALDVWWTYNDANGDLTSSRWANTTAHAYNIRVQKANNVDTFTIPANNSGTATIPGKKYSMVQVLAPDGGTEWGPNFTFSVFRA